MFAQRDAQSWEEGFPEIYLLRRLPLPRRRQDQGTLARLRRATSVTDLFLAGMFKLQLFPRARADGVRGRATHRSFFGFATDKTQAANWFSLFSLGIRLDLKLRR